MLKHDVHYLCHITFSREKARLKARLGLLFKSGVINPRPGKKGAEELAKVLNAGGEYYDHPHWKGRAGMELQLVVGTFRTLEVEQ